MEEVFQQRLQQLYGESPTGIDTPSELSVAIVLAPSFTITPLAGFLDVLRLAADEADYSRQLSCQWTIVGDKKGQLVSSSSGLSVAVWQGYDDIDTKDFDYVVVVGGRLPLSFNLSGAGYDFIRHVHRQQTKLIGLCVGSFLLARLGLLDGKKCAVGFGHEREMNVLFPEVQTYANRLYMEDSNIITCGGGVAAIDLANDLITQHCGKARSIKTMRSMLLDNHRTSLETPALNYDNVKISGNWQLQRVIQYMENHLDNPSNLNRLAEETGINLSVIKQSFKNFLRTTPGKFWFSLRLEHAHHLLLNTDKHLAVIAAESGFHDAAHFTKRYKQMYGVTPIKNRKAHHQQLRVRADHLNLDNTQYNSITQFCESDEM